MLTGKHWRKYVDSCKYKVRRRLTPSALVTGAYGNGSQDNLVQKYLHSLKLSKKVGLGPG